MSSLAVERLGELATDYEAERYTKRTEGYKIAALEDTVLIDDNDESSAFTEEKVKKEHPRLVTPLPRRQDFVEDVKQIFSGFVTKIEGHGITARISDITEPSRPDEEIVFDIHEIDERESDLLELGAQFYWHIGYRQGPMTSKHRFSTIRLRRLPRWTKDELEFSEQAANEYVEFFNAD